MGFEHDVVTEELARMCGEHAWVNEVLWTNEVQACWDHKDLLANVLLVCRGDEDLSPMNYEFTGVTGTC